MIKTVVFDLDNTVYDYNLCHEKGMEKLCALACKRYKLREVDFGVKFNKAKEIVKKQLGNTGASHNRLLYMQTFLELIGEKPAVDAIKLYDTYWDTILKNMIPFAYVIPLMKTLKNRGIVIAVLTDLTAHIQHRKLKKMGLSEYVDVLVTSEEAGQEKPSHLAFDKIKAKLTDQFGFEASELLMIGDSQIKDIDGARKAGINGILFKKEYANKMDKICLEYIDDRVD